MDTVTKVCSLLEQVKALLLNYETATQEMLGCPPEDMEHYIIERDRIANEAAVLNEQIARACSELPNGEVLLNTARGRLDFETVPSEYHCVFYGAQANQSVVGRVGVTEQQVVERMEQLRDEALENIKRNQNLPKIKKYLDNLADKSEISLTDGKA